MIIRKTLMILISSVLTTNLTYASNNVKQFYATSDNVVNAPIDDFKTVYTDIFDGKIYDYVLHKAIPDPNSNGGYQKQFNILRVRPANGDLEKGPVSQLGSSSQNQDTSSDESGLWGNGNAEGFRKGVAGAQFFYNIGSSLVHGASQSKQLISDFHYNKDASVNYINNYADFFKNKSLELEKYNQHIDTNTAINAGQQLGEIDTSHSATNEYTSEFSTNKDVECMLQVDNGGFHNMPITFQQAYLSGDVETLTKYTELLLSGESVSEFCRKNLSTIATSDKLISIAKIKPKLQLSPLEKYRFQTPLKNKAGTLVRKIANLYQIEWLKSDALTKYSPEQVQTYISGVSLLKAADQQAGALDFKHSFKLIKASGALLDIIKGFGDGYIESLNQLADALPQLAETIKEVAVDGYNNPESLIKISQAVANEIPQVMKSIKKQLILSHDTLVNGSAYEVSKLIGSAALDATVGFATSTTTKIAKNSVNIIDRSKTISSSLKQSKSILKKHSSLDYDNYIRGRTLERASNFDLDLIKEQAKRLESVVESLNSNGVTLSDNAKDFLAGQIVGEKTILNNNHFALSDLESSGRLYEKIQFTMKDIEGVDFNGTISRGIPKVVDKVPGGAILYPDKSDVFDVHFGNYYASGRYTQPGDWGMYAVGEELSDEVKEVIAKEVGMKSKDIIYSEAKIASNKILDLTDEKVLENLNINKRNIIQKEYKFTHIIGDIAKKHNYSGLIFPSTKKSTIKNIVLF